MLRAKDKKQVYRVAINAALGSFLFGYELVNISSLEELFANVNKTDAEQTRLMISLITAALPLGAIIGSILLKTIMKSMRARLLMVVMDAVAVLAMGLQDVSLSFWTLFLGRIVLGFVVGINSGLVPQYIYSVTPTQLAGSVGSLHQVFLMMGVATCYSVGFIIVPDEETDEIRWRIELSLPMLTCILRSILVLWLFPYEIPSYKMKDEEIEKLQKYYYKIYQKSNVVDEVSSPTDAMEIKQRSKKRIAQIVCIVLALSNQLCGINAILFYAKQLFMRVTDQNNTASQMIMIGLGLVQIVSTYAGGWLMDKFPKKTFLIGGEATMAVCLFCIFMSSSEIAIILFVFIHTIAYSFSIGQLLMYYPVKMLPNTGIVILVNWFFTFIVALTAQFMMKGLGIGNMCLLFFVLLTLCLTVLIRGIPEEKSKSTTREPLQIKQKPEDLELRTTSISTVSQHAS